MPYDTHWDTFPASHRSMSVSCCLLCFLWSCVSVDTRCVSNLSSSTDNNSSNKNTNYNKAATTERQQPWELISISPCRWWHSSANLARRRIMQKTDVRIHAFVLTHMDMVAFRTRTNLLCNFNNLHVGDALLSAFWLMQTFPPLATITNELPPPRTTIFHEVS